ncbi:hymenoptaecin-like [Diachasmimorpha longicaudata]|uniref:hymenoptaecin-like n=1 Tax=Diachasmimorpha longicaudata TaxID=58733 RepID=UPI0030B87DD4
MKTFVMGLWLVCVIASLWSTVQCQSEDDFTYYPRTLRPDLDPSLPWPIGPTRRPKAAPPRTGFEYRFRRSPQGSIQGGVMVPEQGRPQANVDYNQRVFDNGKSTLDTYGGASTQDGRHFQPHAGASYEYRPRDNVVVRGQGSVQKGPGGRFVPQFGLGVDLEF